MTANEYQKTAHGFASYGGNPMYAYLGLAEEAGEVAGKVAKFIRHNDGLSPNCDLQYALHDEKSKFVDALSHELGDVLWFVAEIATLNGLDMEGLMTQNIAKLSDRKSRGVIDGIGDNR